MSISSLFIQNDYELFCGNIQNASGNLLPFSNKSANLSIPFTYVGGGTGTITNCNFVKSSNGNISYVTAYIPAFNLPSDTHASYFTLDISGASFAPYLPILGDTSSMLVPVFNGAVFTNDVASFSTIAANKQFVLNGPIVAPAIAGATSNNNFVATASAKGLAHAIAFRYQSVL